jgi:hypothetical protein
MINWFFRTMFLHPERVFLVALVLQVALWSAALYAAVHFILKFW